MGAVSVSLCGEQAIVVCKAIKEADGRIHFEFEYVSLEQAVVDEKMLLRAVRDATLLKRGTRVVAVPHPGFNGTDRCHNQNLLEDVIQRYLATGGVERVRLVDRVVACEAATKRPIEEEALRQVAGANSLLRSEALVFGSGPNCELYRLETEYMREEASKLLQDPTKCANTPAAFDAYQTVSAQPGAFLYVADALWNSVCEACSPSAGCKRARAEGCFYQCDTYWGYWEDEEDSGNGSDLDSEEEGDNNMQQQQQAGSVALKRQRLSGSMAA